MDTIIDLRLFKKTFLKNRRYLGNKYKLIPFIRKTILSECSDFNSFADIFAGTGSVVSAFANKIIITNDILYSNFVCNYAWFNPQKVDAKKITDFVNHYNSLTTSQQNYMTENFANTYFSYADCAKIGFIREDIEMNFQTGAINEREKFILITSLIYGMDRIAKTCGHYDAFRKNAVFDTSLELGVPEIHPHNSTKNRCFNKDANDLVKEIEADIVYLDPPYNSRQYGDTYHLLENVARWEKPAVYGIARKMNRDHLKSKYCTNEAKEAFTDLIENIRSKYIVLSYNNMASKGDDRSNAKISDDEIMERLQNRGDIKVFEQNYKAFSTGKSAISDNVERLFLCKCRF